MAAKRRKSRFALSALQREVRKSGDQMMKAIRIRNKKISVISLIHYFRLVYRSVLFLLLLIDYISFRVHAQSAILTQLDERPPILVVTWAIFVVEMVLRFFPSRFESPGCQKQFRQNYIKSGETNIVIHDNNAAILVALIWIIFNGLIGGLRMLDILDDGVLILLCSAYSVCDLICILFFCPFQSWLMKNKCCVTCRIYNWDYAMMFTPLFFVRRDYAWSLLVLSVALLIRWEITFYRHPERFSENTNEYLQCKNCQERLCSHKKQLIALRKHIEAYTAQKIKMLKK